MKKIIVTAGEEFTDIDVLACSIAYNDLLNFEGKNSEVVLKGTFNKSVTNEIKKWNLIFRKIPSTGNCEYVIVDISQPEHIAKFVDQSKIIEFYDHHFGYKEYWQEKIKGMVKIEPVGACATLIFEEFLKRSKPLYISTTNANLLTAAIVSNTLNFKASVTNNRDLSAYKHLKQFTDLPENWIQKYFNDQEELVYSNPVKEIINDTHIEKFPDSNNKLIIGQIELWDSKKLINNYKNEIEKALLSFNIKDWFLTSPSISEGKNYIYTKSEKVRNLLERKIGAKFEGNTGKTERLFLRKEIKKIIYNYSG